MNKILFMILLMEFYSIISFGQDYPEDSLSTSFLKKLSLEELMNINITIASKKPKQLFDTPASVYVIQGNDIKRSGATRIPEALRLAPNMQVAQIDPIQWAISTRGFNSALANKLLVLIDGRSVYSPLFAGVFWDMQSVFLNDIDRIEVIGGPGATLWGSNAVNGVINIVSKNAKDTKGLYAEAGGGTELQGFGGIRYGGSLDPGLHYRIYGKYLSRDGTVSPTGMDYEGDWKLGQGGFRLDWEASDVNNITLHGDIYNSRMDVPNSTDPEAQGGNITGLWTHYISDKSEFKLQFYFDRVHRNIPGSYNDILNTYDIDFQHRFSISTGNNLVLGAGYRLHDDNFMPGSIILIPKEISLQIFNAFVQDEIELLNKNLIITLGTKLEHNDYTGFEYQPGVRLLWKPDDLQALWGAVSRAVRTPSRLDRNWVIPQVSNGSPDYKSENLIAYEAGYRIQPSASLLISIAAYYNFYNNIRSIEQVNPPFPAPLVFGNKFKGEAYGGEIKIDYKLLDIWLLRLGYSFLMLDIHSKPGSTDPSAGMNEAADSDHNLLLNSSMDLPSNLKFDIIFRYVSEINNPVSYVPGYSEIDMRIAWQIVPQLELSVTGQNLLNARHPEFGDITVRQEIERSVYGKITFSLE